MWYIYDCVYWITYRIGSNDCRWSGVSNCVGHLGALGEWWYIHYVEHILFDSLFFISTFIAMLLIFILWWWIEYEGQHLFVIMHPHLLYIDLFVWQLGKSVSCPLSLWLCITDWVEYWDLLWTFDLIMYHIRSMHRMCIDPWGQSADMIVEIYWCRVTSKMGHVSLEDVVTESHSRWDMHRLRISWLSHTTLLVGDSIWG